MPPAGWGTQRLTSNSLILWGKLKTGSYVQQWPEGRGKEVGDFGVRCSSPKSWAKVSAFQQPGVGPHRGETLDLSENGFE